jgi:type I restriction enzyme S subunit
MAVSIEKVFIPAHADLTGVDIGNYLICKNGEFAYNTVTTKNGDKLSIAYNKDSDCLVSPIYTVFKVDDSKILPEYLMLWFIRKELDRYARYNSWGSARETFTFDEMQLVEIPIPDIKIQKSIVEVYKSYIARKEINEKLKAQIKDICPILIKGSLEEGK